MNERLTQEWIEKVKFDFLPIVKENRSKLYRYINSLEATKRGKLKYAKTEKGIAARKKTLKKRDEKCRVKHLSKVERSMIRSFYNDCPAGYEVDHIIPLGKGGEHKMSNLQWIKPEINRKKHLQIYLKETDYPQCIIEKARSQNERTT